MSCDFTTAVTALHCHVQQDHDLCQAKVPVPPARFLPAKMRPWHGLMSGCQVLPNPADVDAWLKSYAATNDACVRRPDPIRATTHPRDPGETLAEPETEGRDLRRWAEHLWRFRARTAARIIKDHQ